MNKLRFPLALLLLGIGLVFSDITISHGDWWRWIESRWNEQFVYQQIHAAVVYESADLPNWPADRVSAFRSIAPDKFLQSKKCHVLWRIDKDDKVPQNQQPFLAAAEDKQLPQLVILDSHGGLITAQPLGDVQALMATLKRYLGE